MRKSGEITENLKNGGKSIFFEKSQIFSKSAKIVNHEASISFSRKRRKSEKTRKQSKVEKREVLRTYQKIEEVTEKNGNRQKMKKRGNPMDSTINSGRRLCPVFSLSGSRGAAPACAGSRSDP